MGHEPQSEGEGTIDRVQAGVLLIGGSILGVVAFFYLAVPEEWMKAMLISTVHC